ncbi:adenylate/guanylate cyclase domain-containing protein [Roseibacterium sp. SDUM158017]|uniref:CHASE2 domain-containing protein n=1 Tax=Roseicyclus salinarum TaxID=3036773 RepID=UPI002415793E|nr:adenylate/guanylate cyclase domain-containing protein [Roseibacterium sp. SDUM158017]MDG4647333.1 adenylate/guanylate cyclase domain-containing protein [Roseibacterium sp. SDUM158017]
MRRRLQRSVLALGLAIVAVLVVLRLFDPLPLQAVRNAYFDYLQIFDPRDYQDLPVVVVDIDEPSLAEFGQWPWPRSLMARMLDELTAAGAAVVAFDVLFAEPDRQSPARLLQDPELAGLFREDLAQDAIETLDNDRRFAEAISRSAVVLGLASAASGGVETGDLARPGLVEIGNRPSEGLHVFGRSTTLVPGLADAAQGLGNINTSPRLNDGRIRTVPLLWGTETGAVATLGIEALRVALGEDTFILRGVGDVRGAVESVQIGGFVIPATSRGEMWVRYRRDDPRLYVSARDVLGRDDPAWLQSAVQGRIVLVGTSAAGLLDIRTTALGETVPGVSIHAQLIEQVLLDDHLTRSDFVAGLEVVAQALLGLMVAFMMARAGPQLSLVAGGLGAVAVIGASWWMFQRHSVLVDATYPLLGGALNFGLLTAYRFVVTDRERRMIRRSFSQYLAPSVLGEIENRGYRIELGGEVRELTVMFTDIRNFTPLSESMAADALVPLLNDLFTDLTEEILERDGTIDKFIGDSVMAFWNAPLTVTDHARQGAMAALAMRAALSRFLARRPDLAQPIGIGIGLHSGDACVGNIGSRQRFNYSAIGDAVNLAARVEASCKAVGFDIVATEAVRERAPDLAWLPLGSLALKGVGRRQTLLALVGGAELAQSEAFTRLAARHDALLARIAEKDDVADELEECRRIAGAILPQLDQLYLALPQRLDDLRAARTAA